MNPILREIDLVQVREVLQGKRYGRRAGNTTAKVLLMLANALNVTKQSNFLFVGERHPHTRDIQRTTLGYLDQLGFDTGKYTVTGQREFGIFGNQIKTWYDGNYINFMFVSANESLPCMIRGTRFEKAFIDVTKETQYKYKTEMNEIRISLY